MNTLPNLSKLLASATPGPLTVASLGKLPEDYYLEEIVTTEDGTAVFIAVGIPLKVPMKQAVADARLLKASYNHVGRLAKALVEYHTATKAMINASNSEDLAQISGAVWNLREVAEQARAALAALDEDCK